MFYFNNFVYKMFLEKKVNNIFVFFEINYKNV